MKKKTTAERGSMLLVSMLLSLILLVMGIAFLAVKALQYQGGGLVMQFARANSLAEAGLKDARIKLEKDLEFPPAGAEDQKLFTYTEEFYDLDGTTRVGNYKVTIDSSLKVPPYSIIRITSLATVGPLEKPYAIRKITAELDVSPGLRDNPTVPNPYYFEYINWQKSGSI